MDYDGFPFPLETMLDVFRVDGRKLAREKLYILAGLLYKKPRPIKHWYSFIWNSRSKFSLLLFWEPVTARDWLDNTRREPPLLCWFLDRSLERSTLEITPLPIEVFNIYHLSLLIIISITDRSSDSKNHFGRIVKKSCPKDSRTSPSPKKFTQIAANPKETDLLNPTTFYPRDRVQNHRKSLANSNQTHAIFSRLGENPRKGKKKGRQKVGTEPDTLGNTVARR